MRQQPTKQYPLSAIDTEILLLTKKFHMLTVDQIIKLRGLSTNSKPKVQTRLKVLFENNYLARRQRFHTGSGNTEFIYALSTKSINLLKELGFDGFSRFRPVEFQQFSFLHVDHALAVSDFLIAATILHRFIPEIELVESRIDQELKKTPIRVKVERRLPGGDKRVEVVSIVPDLWVDFRMTVEGQEKRRRRCICVELDRGTIINPGEFKKRIRAYVPYALSEEYKAMFHTDRCMVAYATTAGTQRMRQIIEWCTSELTQQGLEREANLYRFCSLPQGAYTPQDIFCSPIFYRPFDSTPTSLLWPV